MRTIKTFLFYGVLIFPLGMYGQNYDAERAFKPLKKYVMDRWTTSDGLMSNNLTNVCTAGDGFLYISSYNGLHKFDGINFQLYDKDNLPFLKSNAFYGHFQDPDGKLWFGTQGSGLLVHENRIFRQFEPDQIPSASIRTITKAAAGDYFIGTDDMGVFIYSEGEFRPLPHPDLESVNITSIKEDRNGVIWIGTDGKGLFTYAKNELQKFEQEKYLPDQTILVIKKDLEGDLWVGTQRGIMGIKEDEYLTFPELARFSVNDLDFQNGWIWMASEQGLVRYHPENGKLELFNEKTGLPANQVSSICFDHEGTAWLSTKKEGLLRLKDANFISLTTRDGLSNNKINIVEKYDDRYFIGTDDGVVNVLSGETLTRLSIKTDLNEVGIRDLILDEKGTYWIATYKGLLRIDKEGNEKLYTTADGLPSDEIRRIIEHDNKILIGTSRGGFSIFDKENEFTNYDRFNGLLSNYIFDVDVSAKGDIVLSTNGGGLSMIKSDGSIVNYSVEDNSGVLIFNSVEDEHTGNFWLATNVGVFYFKDGNVIPVRFKDEYKLDTFFDLKEDPDENIWLTSNVGVIQCRESDLLRNLSGEITEVDVRIFDTAEGLPNRECTGATRFYMDDKELWVPTLGGVAIADLKEIKTNTVIPKIIVTEFITDDQQHPDLNQDLAIEPGTNRFIISFTSLSFMAAEKIRFKYILEGFEDGWTQNIIDRQVEYTNLPPGKYTFRVMGSNNDGLWNPQEAAFTFSVKPYFYQTNFFIVLLVLVGGLLTWMIIKFRIKRVEKINSELRKLNNELDSFVYSASHDLRAPLTSVMGLVEVARLDPDMAQKDKYLQLIKSSAMKLDGFIKDIIDFSRNERTEFNYEVVDLEAEVYDHLNELQFHDKNQRIEKIVINKAKNKTCYTDRARLGVLLKNLFSNAINYSDPEKPHPFVRITLDFDGKYHIIVVEDNGIGISAQNQSKIFDMFFRANEKSQGSGLGLYIVKETIAKMKGEVKVKSEEKAGTTFTIKIPYSNGIR